MRFRSPHARSRHAAITGRCMALLFLGWICLAGNVPAHGKTWHSPSDYETISVSVAQPRFGAHRETVVDMRVKVLGGHVRVTRTWYESSWYLNRRWEPLKIARGKRVIDQYRLDYGETYIQTFERNGSAYRRPQVDSDTYVNEDDPRKLIVKTDTGYRWKDLDGNWIDYDEDLRMVAYGDRNDVQVTLAYDSDGNRTGVFDHLGQQILWYEYNADGEVSAIQDYTGRRVEYVWNNGQLVKFIDVRGNEWTYSYSGDLLKTKTNPLGRTVTIGYTSGGIVTSKLDQDGAGSTYKYEFDKTEREFYRQEKSAEGRVTETWYDHEGDVIRRDEGGLTVLEIQKDGRKRIWTDARGNQTIKEYDARDNLIKETYEDGTSVSYQYDARHSAMTRKTDENGVITQWEYDDNGNLIRLTEAVGLPEQRITEYAYDAYGNRTEERRLGDAQTADAVTQYTYDDYGNVATMTDPEGNVTAYLAHDALGNATRIRGPRGNLWELSYDAAGSLLSVTDPLAHTQSYTYDAMGNRIRQTDALGNVTRFSYDIRSRPIGVTDAADNTAVLAYDLDGNLIRITDAQNRTVTLAYDSRGILVQQTDGAGNTISYNPGTDPASASPGLRNAITFPTFTQRYQYDDRNRRTQQINDLGGEQQITRWGYDGSGNVISQQDPKGRVTQYGYDGLNRQIASTDPAGYSTQYAYDSRDNLVAVTNGRSVVIRRYQYDRNDRTTHEIRPDGNTIETRYDAAGNPIERIDAKGQIARYTYDAAGRLTTVDYYPDAQASTPDKSVTYSYDAANRLTGYDDGITSATYTYDELGRKIAETIDYGPFSLAYQYSYYANGRKQTLTTPEGTTYTYSYDDANRLASIQLPGLGSVTVNSRQWYAASKTTLPGGTTWEVTHDPLMRPEHILGRDPAGNPLQDYRYTRDAVGNILESQTEHGTYTYGYDALDRLVSADNPTLDDEAYTYDPVGNRLSNATDNDWQYDDNDQLLGHGDTTYTYDANGSTVQRDENGQVVQYHYNLENRLSRVSDGADSTIARYYYDPFGQRLWKEVDGARTYFLYADEGLIGEYDANGALLQGYIYKPGTKWGTSPIAVNATTGYAFVHADHLGTPRFVSQVNGKIVWSWRSDAFGRTTPNEDPDGDGTAFTLNLRFPGQYFDSETGRHYNWHRYYTPHKGRYETHDPIGLHGGLNVFAYANGNPLAYIDPEGTIAEPVTFVVVFGTLVASAIAACNASPECKDAMEQSMRNLVKNFDKFAHPCVSLDCMPVYNSEKSDDKDCPKEATPTTDKDKFDNVRNSKAKKNKETGEYWEPDLLHKDHWEVYKNKKDWERRRRNRSVWDDGRLKERF